VFDALDGNFAPDTHIYPARIRLLTLERTAIRPRRACRDIFPKYTGMYPQISVIFQKCSRRATDGKYCQFVVSGPYRPRAASI
jgi:hypothetical protein